MYTCFFFFINDFPISCQVLGEMIHITVKYLTNKEKVVMANFEVEVLEAKISKLRKDLIIAMDNGNKKKEQVKALKDELQVEKLLTVQKDEQLQATNQKINSARDKDVQAFKLTDEYKIVLFI